MNTDFFDFADAMLVVTIVIGTPAYFSLQAWTVAQLRGGWRLAALLPVAFLFCCLVEFLSGAATGVAALVFFPPLAAIYLIGLLGAATMIERLPAKPLLLPVEG